MAWYRAWPTQATYARSSAAAATATGPGRAAAAAARPQAPVKETAWEQVVEDHSDRVYRLAYRLTGDRHDAEDLTQEVFVRVFRSLHTYSPGTFEGWLHRITTNLFLDQARRKQRIRFDAQPYHSCALSKPARLLYCRITNGRERACPVALDPSRPTSSNPSERAKSDDPLHMGYRSSESPISICERPLVAMSEAKTRGRSWRASTEQSHKDVADAVCPYLQTPSFLIYSEAVNGGTMSSTKVKENEKLVRVGRGVQGI